jgi:hypothetical protein
MCPVLIVLMGILLLLAAISVASANWDCTILPSEQKVEIDKQNGAKLIFVTTNNASDTNFYFHERCFLLQNRLMLFRSNRFGRSEIMGYLLETGELIRLMRSEDPGVGSAVASIRGDRIYVVKADGINEWTLNVTTQPRTTVHLTERRLLSFPSGALQRTSIDANCDGSLLTYAYDLNSERFLGFCETASGNALAPTKMEFGPGHLHFHRHRPDIVSFCREYGSDRAPLDPAKPRHVRIWTMNVGTRVPLPAFQQVPGELATHECWWVDDQMTFVGGYNCDGDREDGAVKVLDFKTGAIRIIGSGAWIDGVTAKQLAEVNWWHASGSPDGKWVAADNFNGVIALFNAKTTQTKVLTTGHRTYGKDTHPHVGWDLLGECVQFTSDRLGNPDVCIAYIPKDW